MLNSIGPNTGFFAYNSKVVSLSGIGVANGHLKDPRPGITGDSITMVSVKMTHHSISTDPLLSPQGRSRALFVFNESEDENIAQLVANRRRSFHALFGNAAVQTVKFGATGGVVGCALGALATIVAPPAAPCILIGALCGTSAGIVTGAVDAWANERASVRVVDLVLNLNQLHEEFEGRQMNIIDGTEALYELWSRGNDLGDAGKLIFNEGLSSITRIGGERAAQLVDSFQSRKAQGN